MGDGVHCVVDVWVVSVEGNVFTLFSKYYGSQQDLLSAGLSYCCNMKYKNVRMTDIGQCDSLARDDQLAVCFSSPHIIPLIRRGAHTLGSFHTESQLQILSAENCSHSIEKLENARDVLMKIRHR